MRSRDRAEIHYSRAARLGAALLAVASAALVGAAGMREARADGEQRGCGCACATEDVRLCSQRAAAQSATPSAMLTPPAEAESAAEAAPENTAEAAPESDDDVIVPARIGESRLPLLPTTRGELRELQGALEQQRWGVALDTIGVLTCALGTAFFIPLDNNNRVGDFSSGATVAAILLGAGVTTIIVGAVTYSRGSDREAAVTSRVASRLISRPR